MVNLSPCLARAVTLNLIWAHIAAVPLSCSQAISVSIESLCVSLQSHKAHTVCSECTGSCTALHCLHCQPSLGTAIASVGSLLANIVFVDFSLYKPSACVGVSCMGCITYRQMQAWSGTAHCLHQSTFIFIKANHKVDQSLTVASPVSTFTSESWVKPVGKPCA